MRRPTKRAANKHKLEQQEGGWKKAMQDRALATRQNHSHLQMDNLVSRNAREALITTLDVQYSVRSLKPLCTLQGNHSFTFSLINDFDIITNT